MKKTFLFIIFIEVVMPLLVILAMVAIIIGVSGCKKDTSPPPAQTGMSVPGGLKITTDIIYSTYGQQYDSIYCSWYIPGNPAIAEEIKDNHHEWNQAIPTSYQVSTNFSFIPRSSNPYKDYDTLYVRIYKAGSLVKEQKNSMGNMSISVNYI